MEKISHLGTQGAQILVNICLDTPDKNTIVREFKKKFPSAHFISTANIGKDIGGKLILYELMDYLNIDSDWLLFLHDKNSPQSVNGEKWRNELHKIFAKENMDKLSAFMNDKKCGMIGNRENLVEYSRKGLDLKIDPNYAILKKLATEYSLKERDFQYVGGTTFWIRKQILEHFFKDKKMLEIRSRLEKGNVMDNYEGKETHAWERLFGWITAEQKFTINTL